MFAVLCCTKHLFAVAGPWFAVFLFRAHCLGNSAAPGQVLWRAAKLGITVLVVLLLAFGPFAAMGQVRPWCWALLLSASPLQGVLLEVAFCDSRESGGPYSPLTEMQAPA